VIPNEHIFNYKILNLVDPYNFYISMSPSEVIWNIQKFIWNIQKFKFENRTPRVPHFLSQSLNFSKMKKNLTNNS
jgi:hypothetical protein